VYGCGHGKIYGTTLNYNQIKTPTEVVITQFKVHYYIQYGLRHVPKSLLHNLRYYTKSCLDLDVYGGVHNKI